MKIFDLIVSKRALLWHHGESSPVGWLNKNQLETPHLRSHLQL